MAHKVSEPDPAVPHSPDIFATGPWPFITRRHLRVRGRPDRIWRSRHHRRGLVVLGDIRHHNLVRLLVQSLQEVHRLNWWIGTLFAIGSMLFMLGSVFVLSPAFAGLFGFDETVANAVFFAGSIPFSTAAFLQLYQAGRAPSPPSVPGEKTSSGQFPGLKLHDIGWLSCALQFGGTLSFNINTFDAMWPDLDRIQYDLAIWVPDFLGSLLFLTSGYLAFAEVGHAYWSWRPRNISWLATGINLLGCVAFMISAVLAFEPIRPFDFDAGGISVAFTLAGAIAFLVGSLLMLTEGVEQI